MSIALGRGYPIITKFAFDYLHFSPSAKERLNLDLCPEDKLTTMLILQIPIPQTDLHAPEQVSF